LRYQIATHTYLSQVFQVNEELASLIRYAIGSAATVEELVNAVETKRYTKARVPRVLTYVLVTSVETPLTDEVHVICYSA
ncbi:nucleotidyltransferase family protein, partial [Streptococcus suis]